MIGEIIEKMLAEMRAKMKAEMMVIAIGLNSLGYLSPLLQIFSVLGTGVAAKVSPPEASASIEDKRGRYALINEYTG